VVWQARAQREEAKPRLPGKFAGDPIWAHARWPMCPPSSAHTPGNTHPEEIGRISEVMSAHVKVREQAQWGVTEARARCEGAKNPGKFVGDKV
jgi:hypothetical protein